LKKYKLLLGNDQIAAELIQARGKTLVWEIHKLVNSVWNKKELSDQWKDSVAVSSPECRSKLGHKNRKQIMWKCITVQMFGNDSNKSKFDSGRN
jgi:hypothetical protein